MIVTETCLGDEEKVCRSKTHIFIITFGPRVHSWTTPSADSQGTNARSARPPDQSEDQPYLVPTLAEGTASITS